MLWTLCYDCLSLYCDDTTSSLAGDLTDHFSSVCVRSKRITNACNVCLSTCQLLCPRRITWPTHKTECGLRQCHLPCVQVERKRGVLTCSKKKRRKKAPLKNNMTLKYKIKSWSQDWAVAYVSSMGKTIVQICECLTISGISPTR